MLFRLWKEGCENSTCPISIGCCLLVQTYLDLINAILRYLCDSRSRVKNVSPTVSSSDDGYRLKATWSSRIASFSIPSSYLTIRNVAFPWISILTGCDYSLDVKLVLRSSSLLWWFACRATCMMNMIVLLKKLLLLVWYDYATCLVMRMFPFFAVRFKTSSTTTCGEAREQVLICALIAVDRKRSSCRCPSRYRGHNSLAWWSSDSLDNFLLNRFTVQIVIKMYLTNLMITLSLRLWNLDHAQIDLYVWVINDCLLIFSRMILLLALRLLVLGCGGRRMPFWLWGWPHNHLDLVWLMLRWLLTLKTYYPFHCLVLRIRCCRKHGEML